MEPQKQKYEIKQGGPTLTVASDQMNAILQAYSKQFEPQGGKGPTHEVLQEYLEEHILKNPDTVLLFEGEEFMAMGSIRYFPPHVDFPNDEIVELTTFAVAEPFQGKGLSREVFNELETQALLRAPHDKGVIFTLITATPQMAHMSESKGYQKIVPERFIELSTHSVETPAHRTERADHLRCYHYQPYINETHSSRNLVPVISGQKGIRGRVLRLLGALFTVR